MIGREMWKKRVEPLRVRDLRGGDSVYGFLAQTKDPAVIVRITGWVLDGFGDPDGDEVIFYQRLDHPGERVSHPPRRMRLGNRRPRPRPAMTVTMKGQTHPDTIARIEEQVASASLAREVADSSPIALKNGQVWREVEPRFVRHVLILQVPWPGGERRVKLIRAYKAGPNWVAERGAHHTWAKPERFNSKRGGYELVEDSR